jgi:hypothetical protein
MPRGQQATTVVDRPLRTTRKNGGADQGNLLRSIDIWSGATYKGVPLTIALLHHILIHGNFKNLQYKTFVQL